MTAEPELVGITEDFPVEFADPTHASLTWEWDDMHMPFALTPLAADWIRVIGQGLGSWRAHLGVDFPNRTHTAIWNGYAFFAYDPGAEGDERKRNSDAMTALFRAQEAMTDAYWRDEALPELRSIYQANRELPIEDGSRTEAADAWQAGWAGAERAWRIHFIVILGPYQVLEDLADLYETHTPGASAGEAMRLILGVRHELFETEVGVERLAAVAAASPTLAAALRAGERSRAGLAAVDGGPAFDRELGAFLDEHGHLGQSVDDLTLASWGEDPGLLLAELAKRLGHAPESAEARRARLAREADELAEALRGRLADKPDVAATFEGLLELARRIGPITESHNYWIDRAAQASIRRLALRAGARLAREGVLGQAEDVFCLTRDEVAVLLRQPEDRRPLIAERRALHERQAGRKPPAYVGKPPTPSEETDRFDTAKVSSTEAGILKGSGASAGVVRGTARVVLSSAGFDRIQPGDVIVCPSSNPSWVPVFTIAGGLVTNSGGVLSHAAVVAREFGLPAVVGVAGATTTIRDGQAIEIDGTAGTVRLL